MQFTLIRVGILNLPHDHSMPYVVRNGISKLRVLVASEYDSASSSGKWHKVTEYSGEAIKEGITLNFTAVGARWLRIETIYG